MAKIKYEVKNFNPATMETITQAEAIITEYQSQGFSLTLRQIYYQFVARGLIPNTERSYKRIGNIVSDARRAGLIDWNAIEDRTRFIRSLSNWDKPQDILESAKNSYHRDLWATQDKRIEVWIEKDALVGVIEPICQENDVPFFSCRGYVSDSEMWRAAMRMRRYTGQSIIVLHLGDHDPSGIDMIRDIKDRLRLFSRHAKIEVRRIALTMEQVEEQDPPPNPAKITDSRYASYALEYGDKSWELDALEPQYISDLIRDQILEERDEKKWEAAVAEQEEERKQIQDIIDRWNELFGS
ncbi:hypothetical protein LCGC14_2944500 [marine sediment metagenome]|uniref:DUF2399 domain-containing protein n=1 Tax=marine sediment metagenome TaxID=412755 RepID=A0A0F8ZPR6_9ZZZZ